ncbi:MAG: AAA domain-containing protein [Vulcanimicrobiaceae bacterium]
MTSVAEQAPEIDFFLFTDDHVFLVDFKHWTGKIESRNGIWYRDGKRRDRSPVIKIVEHAKKFPDVLVKNVIQLLGKKPRVEACVVFTNEKAVDISGLTREEQPHAWLLSQFTGLLNNEQAFYQRFQRSPFWGKQHSLSEKNIKKAVEEFFRGPKFEVREAVFEGYKPDVNPTFVKKNSAGRPIYSEYDSELLEDPRKHALLRYWDFSNLSGPYLHVDERKAIASRERAALAFIETADAAFYDDFLLKPKLWDDEYNVNYWEILDVRSSVVRILDFMNRERDISVERREEVASAILARLSEMHEVGVAHRDIGGHSVWFDQFRQRVMLSMFTSAHFPERESIGAARYELTAGQLVPNDGQQVTPSRVDVFLAGLLVWQVLFGERLPVGWNSSRLLERVEQSEITSALKGWFGSALAVDERTRFKDCTVMLDAFCLATKRPRRSIDLDKSLDMFRKPRPALISFPIANGNLKNRARGLVWESSRDDGAIFVKQWSRPDKSDGKALLLQFLERVSRFSNIEAPWLPEVLDFGWNSGDFYVAQRDAQGIPWAEAITQIDDLDVAFVLANEVVNAIEQLHAIGFAHGDIKSDNIRVAMSEGTAPSVLLLDLFDYAGPEDGEIVTPEMADHAVFLDPFVRDRAAVGSLLTELLGAFNVSPGPEPGPEQVFAAVKECEDAARPWESLAPIVASFERAREFEKMPSKTLSLGVEHASKDRLLSRDGLFDVVVDKNERKISIFGLDDAVELTLDGQNCVVHARLVNAENSSGYAFKMSIFKFRGVVRLYDASQPPPDEAKWILEQLPVQAALAELVGSKATMAPSAEPEAMGRERIADIQALWRGSIDVEDEAIPRLRLMRAPARDATRDALILYFDGDLSSLRTDGDEKIQIWSNGVRIGSTRASELTSTYLWAYECGARASYLAAGDLIALQTASSRENLSRRSRAVDRVLAAQSVIPDIISYLEPLSKREPLIDPVPEAREIAVQRYGLKDEQIDAFDLSLASGPISFVHGPPGTGKTRFIASIVHYGVVSKRFERVIVSSQSNEAVNNVAEKLQGLFADEASAVMLRVGPQANVSTSIMPLHSAAIQGRYRELFIAEEMQRVSLAASDLGLPGQFAEALLDFHRRMRRAKSELLDNADEPGVVWRRVLGELGFDHVDEEVSYLEILMERFGVTNLNAAKRLEYMVSVGRRWRGALAGGRRNLEELLCASRPIIIGTCVGLGRSSLKIDATTFDLAIIDEAARCSPGELAIVMQSAKKVILVGDHKQLPPYLERANRGSLAATLHIRDQRLLDESDFERGIHSEYGSAASQRLNSQRRMRPGIGNLVSYCFYEKDLQTKRESFPPAFSLIGAPYEADVTWLDTGSFVDDAAEQKIGRFDFQNQTEADTIVALIRDLMTRSEFWTSYDSDPVRGIDAPIGVICGYAKQAELVQERLYTSGLSADDLGRVKIGTVDSYQGKENPIVILSLVRSNDIRDIGYLRDSRRINVAVSRAMERLIIVGDMSFFLGFDSPVRRVASHVKENPEYCVALNARSLFGKDENGRR